MDNVDNDDDAAFDVGGDDDGDEGGMAGVGQGGGRVAVEIEGRRFKKEGGGRSDL